jgi:hypothetical protein
MHLGLWAVVAVAAMHPAPSQHENIDIHRRLQALEAQHLQRLRDRSSASNFNLQSELERLGHVQ